jgi:DeoR/GlpR family transcriptional regulator of sugar metabolism
MTAVKATSKILSPEERQSILLERINATGRVLAATAAEELGVSEDSIRRDLRDMTDAGLVSRFHGGAAKLITPPLDFQRREVLDAGEKSMIARAAAARIPEGSTLLLDSSTTVLHFVWALSPSLKVRIMTSAVDIAAAALDHPQAEVLLIGGRLNRLTRSATGASALEAIRGIRADICVLGTCGVDDELAVRADDFEDAYIKGAMIKSSRTAMLLTTSDKLGKASTHHVSPVSSISTLFTGHTENSITRRISEKGVEVVMV